MKRFALLIMIFAFVFSSCARCAFIRQKHRAGIKDPLEKWATHKTPKKKLKAYSCK